ncbi:MAG TPA: Dabb family protein [Firmicutes bacterium]|jgi:hypothetical protein|nr:Dabb family protein [Bacillota bacterium]
MIEHIVLLKKKPEATDEQMEELVARLKALQDKIPNILDLTVGYNFSARGQGFTIGLVVRFPDKAALEVYQPHPAHQEVVQYIRTVVSDLIVVDYEF